MVKDVLRISEHTCGQYYIAWYCDGEEGACVGEFRDRNDRVDDMSITEDVAKDDQNASFVPRFNVYMWDSLTHARAALKKMKLAIKLAEDNKPLPEWARKALDEGWIPPKGWKPGE